MMTVRKQRKSRKRRQVQLLVKLVGLEGPYEGQSRVLSPGTHKVGRWKDAGIWLDDPMVSGEHAEISISDREVTVKDLSSLNGTYVNDTDVENRIVLERLHNNDVVSFGFNSVFGLRIFRLRPVGSGVRIAAALIDFLLLAPLLLGGWWLILHLTGAQQAVGSLLLKPGSMEFQKLVSGGGLQPLGLCALWGLFAGAIYDLAMNAALGQTPGKKWMGLKLIREDGSPLGPAGAAQRYAIRIMMALFTAGLAYLTIPFQPYKRAPYDRLAGARVAYSSDLETPGQDQ